MSQFQLFPPPTPENRVSKNPFRREIKKSAMGPEPTSPIPLAELKGSKTETVLLQIIEDTNNVQPPPKAYVSRKASLSIPETIREPSSPESLHQSSPRMDRTERRPSPIDKINSSPLAQSSSNCDAQPTRQQSPQPSNSPVVPIKSIFPIYNPSLPLSHQQYFPEPSRNFSRPHHNPRGLTISPPPEIDRTLGPKTVPADIVDFPTDILDPVEVQYSSEGELRTLWEAANGQKPLGLRTFNLRMERTGPATFTFGDPSLPFYTMQSYSTNELCVSRAHPSKPNSGVPVMTLKLEDRSRRDQPNDGLISLLFSRLAAMLAIGEAEELAKQHGLSPTEAAGVEKNALKRAAAQESCRLLWNNEKQVYELQHPSLGKQQPLVGAAGIALSPVRSNHAGTIHITVSTPSKDSKSRQPPTIIATTPLSANAVEAAILAATPRTSTLPLTDLDEPLASLDLGTMTLSISASAIINTIPSLYAIDSLIAAMLAVAVADESTNPALADMELYDPTKKHASTQYQSSMFNSTRFTGELFATFAEREDAEEANRLMSKIKSTKSRSKSKSETSNEQNKSFRFWGRSTPKKSKNKKIVVEEFDLEKYGQYGSGSSREGEKLPGITRGVISLLFFTLDLVVHGLALMVKILAWLLVSLTRCVTSEKF